jgi:hypothetical protein
VNVEDVGLAHHACPGCAGWVDAKRVADYPGRDRESVYRNALRLGGRKLGDGPKAPWVFKLSLVDAALEAMTKRATCSPSRGSEAVHHGLINHCCFGLEAYDEAGPGTSASAH